MDRGTSCGYGGYNVNYEVYMIGGLKPKSYDVRDMKLGQAFDLPSLSELPKSFHLDLPRVLHQGFNTDFCSATAGGSLVELHEKAPLAWQWAFAVGKLLDGGDVDSFGLELRTICKVLVKYGIPEEKDIPAEFASKPPEFLRRIENWPNDLYDKALKHRQGSFVSITGDTDAFDDIRRYIFKFKNQQNGVLFGVLWGWSLNQIIMETAGESNYGHALASLGWDEKDGKPYLYIQNSYGEEAGEGGRHYFGRDVINKNVDIYGAFAFNDLTKEDLRQVIQDRQLLQLSFIEKILFYLRKYFKEIVK